MSICQDLETHVSKFTRTHLDRRKFSREISATVTIKIHKVYKDSFFPGSVSKTELRLKTSLRKNQFRLIWSIFSKAVATLTVQFENLKLNDVFRPFQSGFRLGASVNIYCGDLPLWLDTGNLVERARWRYGAPQTQLNLWCSRTFLTGTGSVGLRLQHRQCGRRPEAVAEVCKI